MSIPKWVCILAATAVLAILTLTSKKPATSPAPRSSAPTPALETEAAGAPDQPDAPDTVAHDSLRRPDLEAFPRRISAALRSGRADAAMQDFESWALVEPSAAARFAESMPPGPDRIDAMRVVARTWAGSSPEVAMSWVKAAGTDDDRTLVRELIAYRIAEDDPLLALRLSTESGAGLAAPVMIDLTQQWADRDPSAAKEWALAQPNGAPRDALIARVALSVARSQPAEAGQLVVDQISPGPTQDEAAISVLYQWALRDPQAAKTWVQQFPTGPLRRRAEAELKNLAEKDSGAE